MKDNIEPSFLKWPGGKRWLVSQLMNIMPQEYNHYYEPFVGGGSMFFALKPTQATLSDINKDLINLYIVMRDHSVDLKAKMIIHNSLHSDTYYYSIRAATPKDNVERAAQFLYLNRTCYNGMYRVNMKGKFNVPIGTKKDCIYDIDKFDYYAEVLKNATILVSDFEPVIQLAAEGDLIIADPPYASKDKNGSFIKYNEKLFNWDDQLRLHKALVEAMKKKAKIILTNAYCKDIIELYKNSGFSVSQLSRFSGISGKSSGRGAVSELLITSF